MMSIKICKARASQSGSFMRRHPSNRVCDSIQSPLSIRLKCAEASIKWREETRIAKPEGLSCSGGRQSSDVASSSSGIGSSSALVGVSSSSTGVGSSGSAGTGSGTGSSSVSAAGSDGNGSSLGIAGSSLICPGVGLRAVCSALLS